MQQATTSERTTPWQKAVAVLMAVVLALGLTPGFGVQQAYADAGETITVIGMPVTSFDSSKEYVLMAGTSTVTAMEASTNTNAAMPGVAVTATPSGDNKVITLPEGKQAANYKWTPSATGNATDGWALKNTALNRWVDANYNSGRIDPCDQSGNPYAFKFVEDKVVVHTPYGAEWDRSDRLMLWFPTAEIFSCGKDTSEATGEQVYAYEVVEAAAAAKTDISAYYISATGGQLPTTGAFVPSVTVKASQEATEVLDAANYDLTYYSDSTCATEVAAANITTAGTYYVKATGKGDYEGATTNAASFEVTAAAETQPALAVELAAGTNQGSGKTSFDVLTGKSATLYAQVQNASKGETAFVTNGQMNSSNDKGTQEDVAHFEVKWYKDSVAAENLLETDTLAWNDIMNYPKWGTDFDYTPAAFTTAGTYQFYAVAEWSLDGYVSATSTAFKFTVTVTEPVISALTGVASPAAGGTVKFYSDSNKQNEITAGNATQGDYVYVDAKPSSGYTLKSIEVKDADNKDVESYYSYYNRFTMPDKAVIVTATFEQIVESSITTASSEHGTVVYTVNNSAVTTAKTGDEVHVAVTPDAGYKRASVSIVDGDNNTVAFDTYSNTFVMPSSEAKVTVTYSELPKYSVTKLSSIDTAKGDISFDKSEFYAGDDINVTITPVDGYELDKITLYEADGETVISTQYFYGKSYSNGAGCTIADNGLSAVIEIGDYWGSGHTELIVDAQFVIKQFNVSFVDADGETVLKEARTYDYGTKASEIEKPADPTKAADDDYAYVFDKWDPELADVTADATYKATYKAISKVDAKADTKTRVSAEGGIFDAPKPEDVASYELSVEPASASDEAKAKTDHAALIGTNKVVGVFDVDLTKHNTDGTNVSVTEGVGALKLTFPVDADDGTVAKVIQVHDNGTATPDVIEHTELKVADKKVIVTLNDKLSTFIVTTQDAATDEGKIDDNTKTDDGAKAGDGAKTGDKTDDSAETDTKADDSTTSGTASDGKSGDSGKSSEGATTGGAKDETATSGDSGKSDSTDSSSSSASAGKAAGKVMYRLYNAFSGEHLYTADAAERDGLVGVGWTAEGEGWTAPAESDTPVYRLYNPFEPLGDHHYTTDAAERDDLVAAGWADEGIGWYSDDGKGEGLFRLYNPNAYATGMSGAHHYTVSESERDELVAVGWMAEDIAWYGMK